MRRVRDLLGDREDAVAAARRRVTSVAWGIDAPWGRAVVTITTADEPLSWPDGGQR